MEVFRTKYGMFGSGSFVLSLKKDKKYFREGWKPADNALLGIIVKIINTGGRMKKNKNISSFKTTGRKYAYLNIFTVLRMVYFLKKNKIDTIIYNSFEDVRLGGFAAVLAGVKVQIFRSGMPKYIKEKK